MDKAKELREMERGTTASSISNMISGVGASVNQYYTDKTKRKQEQTQLKILEDGSMYLISKDINGQPTGAIKIKQ
jgi:hypothetical protein